MKRAQAAGVPGCVSIRNVLKKLEHKFPAQFSRQSNVELFVHEHHDALGIGCVATTSETI